jgi:hypothetical protein
MGRLNKSQRAPSPDGMTGDQLDRFRICPSICSIPGLGRGGALSMCNMSCPGEFAKSNSIPPTIFGMMPLQK